MELLIINSCLYFFAIFFYYKKKCSLDLGFFLLAAFFLSSVGSCWYYTYYVASHSYTNLTLLAFIYLFGLTIVCLLPILRQDMSNIRYVRTYQVSEFLTICSFIFAIASVIPFFQLISKISFGSVGLSLGKMYESNEDNASLLFSGVGKISFSVIRHFGDVVLVLWGYQLTLQKKNVFLLLGLSISLLTFLLFGFLSGSRGGILFNIVGIFSVFLILKNVLDKKIVRLITRWGLISIIVIAFLFLLISISRFDYAVSESDDAENSFLRWISQYIGEGMMRFNHTIWNLNTYMDGAQNFNYFLDLFGFISFSNYESLVNYYGMKLQTPVDVFYTFIGDFVIDFGILGAPVFCFILYWLLKKTMHFRKGGIEIWQLIILIQFCHLFFFGFASNVYRGYYIQESLIYSWVFALITYLIPRLKRV
ncbi:oligosaccharide repeat unit polymerase [Flavobacterium zhairuonense]|uniref:O-antigen polymerase n=1 Tax=Flavobacterium zhairuonense TaxID=2493631 RepID=UPI0010439C81|nr:O-antigen polymerase [Flavobacterium zhairuonense]KAF2509239.1 oligosaccharide repeat unit polymerase [Flavobacterium zhairuonense]